MTRDADIERVLERWFTEGPTQMPDHFFNLVVDRIDRVPQRRLARLVTRFAAMNLNIRIAAAAIIIAVAGIGAVALTGSRGVTVGPSPSPTATSTPTATAVPSPIGGPIPTNLQHLWTGPTRSVAGMTPPSEFASVLLTDTTMRFVGGDAAGQELTSTVSAIGTDQLRFALDRDVLGCAAGAVGTYAFVLSPGGGYLSLTSQGDACDARLQAISGDWERTDCPDQTNCRGDLEAGVHQSTTFNPFVPRNAWSYSYGRLSYSVPDGWANVVDGPDGFILVEQGAPAGDAIYLFATTLPNSQAAGCPGAVQPGVGHTSSALARWLGTLPGLITTAPKSTTLGGLRGKTLDVSVAPGWTRTCPYSNGRPYVAMFTNALPDTPFDWGLTAGARMRLFLLDLPDGRTMLIDVEAQDTATWDGLVQDAMPIVRGFQFNH